MLAANSGVLISHLRSLFPKLLKPFIVVYPDHSKKHVTSAQKEQMLLAGELRQIGEREYAFAGEVLRFHSLSDLSVLQSRFQPTNFKRFYPGRFVWEHAGKKRREMLESPEAMMVRMEA